MSTTDPTANSALSSSPHQGHPVRCNSASASPTRCQDRPAPPYLVVTDIEAAYRELTERGLTVSPIRHKTSTDDWQGDYSPGVDPERRNYASFIDFADPDGNTWIVQERGFTRA